MAKFKKILSFLKGSKKRKSVVIHDSRSIRNNEIPFGGLAGNGNMRFGANTGRPIVGNGGHYEQFLYIDDVKNGGLKKRTLSVAPSVVSSSNYTQTDCEFSDTLSHLRSESSKFDRHGNRNGKSIASRMNGIGTLNKNTGTKSPVITKKVNKSFTLRQDPIEEERVIVEVQDNNEDEIEIDEDELIAAIEEFDKERKGTRVKRPLSSNTTDHETFIIKEDENGNNQSFIIKNINDDVHTKKLSFILSSANQQEFNIDETEEENGNSLSSYLLSTPNITYSSNDKSNNDVNIEIKGIENMKKDYLANVRESLVDKSTANIKESLIQFQPPEFSITNEKVYNYRNNDIIKTIFKKIPHNDDIEKNNDSVEDEDEVLGNLQNKKKVNFVINNKSKTNTQNNSTLTKNLSTKSSDAAFMYTPKPILIPSPKLTRTTTNSGKTNELVNRAQSLNHKTSIKRINSTGTMPKTKISEESLSRRSSKRENINEINELNENLKQSSSAYTSAVPSSASRNIFFMPLPRPSQATLLDFGNSTKNTPSITSKKSNLYIHNNHSVGTFPTSTKESTSLSPSSTNRHHPWNENITSPIKSKEGNLYSAPLKASIPIINSNSTKLGSRTSSTRSSTQYKLNNNQSTPYSLSKYKKEKEKEKTIPSTQLTSTPYMINRRETIGSMTESSSSQSYISEIPKDKPYLLSPNISINNLDIEIDQQSNNTMTSDESSFITEQYNKKLNKSHEESLRNVKEYVQSLDENPDNDSLFSTPLAYRKRYEKYGSLRSRGSNSNHQVKKLTNRTNSNSTISGGSLKSTRKLNQKSSIQSNASVVTEGSSITEFSNSNCSDSHSSYSVHTNSTNRTAPTQNSIYTRDYFVSSAKKYNTNKPLPIPTVYKFKTSLEENKLGEPINNTLKKEKFNSDSTIVNSYNKKYNSSSPMKHGKHQYSSSISSASTLACSPLPVPRSVLNNSSNLNKLSLLAADSSYFDDFMKDLNNMSLNDLISKYEQRTEE